MATFYPKTIKQIIQVDPMQNQIQQDVNPIIKQ